jgi:hypothetical protein
MSKKKVDAVAGGKKSEHFRDFAVHHKAPPRCAWSWTHSSKT